MSWEGSGTTLKLLGCLVPTTTAGFWGVGDLSETEVAAIMSDSERA
jgi:hypothetical protein